MVRGNWEANKNSNVDGKYTNDVGALDDGSPEQRRGVDEMVEGRSVPNLLILPPIARSRSINNWKKQVGIRTKKWVGMNTK